jgi:hypothetical protein
MVLLEVRVLYRYRIFHELQEFTVARKMAFLGMCKWLKDIFGVKEGEEVRCDSDRILINEEEEETEFVGQIEVSFSEVSMCVKYE